MIYIEFFVRMIVLNFWGYLFWVTGPPKSRILAGSAPNAEVLGPSEEFSKRFTYICSSASGLQSQPKKWRFIQISAVPHPKYQKRAGFASFSTIFNQMVGAPRFSRWAVISSAYPSVQMQTWTRTWGVLKILLTGWDIGAFLRAFQGKISKNRQFKVCMFMPFWPFWPLTFKRP